jgi:hypothetical protein
MQAIEAILAISAPRLQVILLRSNQDGGKSSVTPSLQPSALVPAIPEKGVEPTTGCRDNQHGNMVRWIAVEEYVGNTGWV